MADAGRASISTFSWISVNLSRRADSVSLRIDGTRRYALSARNGTVLA